MLILLTLSLTINNLDAHHININFFNDCIDEIQQVLINLMRNDAWSSELFDVSYS